MNFMKLPKEYATWNSKYFIFPIKYEGKMSFVSGASRAPESIIRASSELEYYDEGLDLEAFLSGIKTLKALNLSRQTPKKAVELISSHIKAMLSMREQNRFILSLGGDHSISIGVVDGFEKIYKNFSVIIFDAHSDLRYSWNNSIFNHACVSRRIVGKHKVLLLGVRSISSEEKEFIDNNKNRIKIIKARDFSRDDFKKKLIQCLNSLDNNVYISIDVDVFDPSIIRFTGTPEPGGLDWFQINNALQIIFKVRNVIGADLVEFSPKGDFQFFTAEAYTLAKLVYRIFGYKEKLNA